MSFSYLGSLLLAIGGLGIIDYRLKLAFFNQRRRTLVTVGSAMALFLVWDSLGVASGIFYVGSSAYLSGIRVLPEVPVEEIFFLLLLCYLPLLLLRYMEKVWRPI